MAEKKGYKTLKEVRDAYPHWEKEQAFKFAWDAWTTAEKLVKEKDKEAEYYEKEKMAAAVYVKLYNAGILSICITDKLRENVVRLHARGISTTEIVKDILGNDYWKNITPFYLFSFSDVCGYENIKKLLVSRLGYLKKSHKRFPVKKFGKVWKEERKQFIENLTEIPLATPIEQMHELTQHYQKLKILFDEAKDAKDKERYHNCMMRTLAAIHLIARDPSIQNTPPALTQEKKPKALPDANNEEVLEFTVKTNQTVKTN